MITGRRSPKPAVCDFANKPWIALVQWTPATVDTNQFVGHKTQLRLKRQRRLGGGQIQDSSYASKFSRLKSAGDAPLVTAIGLPDGRKVSIVALYCIDPAGQAPLKTRGARSCRDTLYHFPDAELSFYLCRLFGLGGG